MIYKSLIISLAILILVNSLIRLTRYTVIVTLCLCFVGLLACPLLHITLPPPATWQAVAVSLLLAVLLVPRWDRRLYLALSVRFAR